MKKIVVWYQAVDGEPSSYEYDPPSDIDAHMIKLAEVTVNGGLFSYHENGKWIFSIPSSRVLKIGFRP